jgi:hypothetical protein
VKKSHKKWLLALTGYAVIMLIVVSAAGAGAAMVVLGDKIVGFKSVDKQSVDLSLSQASPEIIAAAERNVGEDVRQALDCSSWAPAERRPGENCLNGLLMSFSGDNPSPVPPSAAWKVPIWQKAAQKYKIPWQLLAAVEGTRSYFGQINCQAADGIGSYRFSEQAWNQYRENAGSMRLKKTTNNCWKAIPPDQAPPGKTKAEKKARQKIYKIKMFKSKPLDSLKEQGPTSKAADPYDPVDSTFSMARMIANQGGFNNPEWEYSGSPSNKCSAPPSDGRIWYLPQMDLGYGEGARLGYNELLEIPRSVVLLAAKYRSNKGKYMPRRDHWAIDDKLGYHPVPKKNLIKMLKAAWYAFGYRGQELNYVVSKNYDQISLESGGRAYILQGLIGDVNDNNPAGGLFGFLDSTMEHWKVDGYNDRFNPLDNILAAVNAQVNGPYKILDGSMGWSPPLSENPYAEGGHSRVVGSADGEIIPEKPYQGKPQIDPISKALKYYSPTQTNSDCYVAVVHDWYKEIKANPPEAVIGGPLRTRIVKIAQSELAKNVYENGTNLPTYRSNGQVAAYSIVPQPWCQAFAARIWYWAGIKKQMLSIGGMTGADGLALPAYTGAVTAWGQSKNLYKTANPQPGDMLFYSDRHVEIVEKVRGGTVLSSIGGNVSDAVTRVAMPSGYTHLVSPPEADSAASYEFSAAPNSSSLKQTEAFNAFSNTLSSKIYLAVGSGSNAKVFGSISNAKAWKTISAPVMVAYYLETGKRVDAAKAWNKLVNKVGEKKAKVLVQSIFLKVKDRQTKINTQPSAYSPLSQTFWRGDQANSFYKALFNNKLIKPQAVRKFKWPMKGWGKDDLYPNQYSYRESLSKGNQLTVVTINKNLKVAQNDAQAIIKWATKRKIYRPKAENNSGSSNTPPPASNSNGTSWE